MLFSIVVPVYKVEEYLDRCVKSLSNQIFRDIEIILVDDGSPDNCPKLCDKYAKNDNRIRVIHKQNGGLSDARNVGVKAASGEYIIFVDSDDYIEKDTCEKFEQFTKEKSDILIGDAIVENGYCNLDHSDSLLNLTLDGETYLKKSFTQKKSPMAAWLNVYRREFLLKNELFFKYGILHEDEQFTPRAFLKAKNVCYTGIIFYHYVLRENSITTKKDKTKNAQDLINTCFELLELSKNIEDKLLNKLLKDSLVEKYLSIFYLADLNRYGKKYVYKKFIWKNSFRFKTRLKSILFIFSPVLYCKTNKLTKKKE